MTTTISTALERSTDERLSRICATARTTNHGRRVDLRVCVCPDGQSAVQTLPQVEGIGLLVGDELERIADTAMILRDVRRG